MNSKHPLHPLFTWEKEAAAKKCWIEEAKYIIRHLLVYDETEANKEAVRAFVNVATDEDGHLTHNLFAKGESTFVSIDEIINTPELREYAIQRALRELESFRKKYHNLTVFKGIIREIDKILPVKIAASKKPIKTKH